MFLLFQNIIIRKDTFNALIFCDCDINAYIFCSNKPPAWATWERS